MVSPTLRHGICTSLSPFLVSITTDLAVSQYHSKLICAQDKTTREFMIKPVLRGSDEQRIYDLLKASPASYDDDNFSYVLPSVEMLEYDNEIVLAIMPR